MPVGEESARYEGWRVVGACGVGAIFAPLPLVTFGVFLQPLCDHFGWSRESASTAYGALTLTTAVSAPWLGMLLDRAGSRRVIVPCLALSGCGVLSLAAMTSSIWHFRTVFVVLGVAAMGASPIAFSRAIFGWFDALRGRALGLMLAGSAIAGIVLPPAAEALIRTAGWRVAWLVLGTSTLVIALPAAGRFIHDRSRRREESSDPVQPIAVRAALRSRVFWTLAAVTFGNTLLGSGTLVHIVALLGDRGVPATAAALSVSALGVAALAGRLLTGWLLDRFPAARVSVVLLAIAAIGAFVLAGAQSLAVGIIAGLCIGFGAGGELDVTPYLLSRHFGLRSLSTLYGFNWTAWGLAGAVGPVFLGRAFDATGSYAAGFIDLGMVSLAASGLMLTLPAVPRGPVNLHDADRSAPLSFGRSE